MRQETQLRAVEGSVIVDPALDLRIDLPSQAGQVLAAAGVEVPAPDLLAFHLPRRAADGRGEASEIASAAFGQAALEGVAEEIEGGVFEVPRRFASWQYTMFVLTGCSSRPKVPSLLAMAARSSRAWSSVSQ
jgi:hypothetical protein